MLQYCSWSSPLYPSTSWWKWWWRSGRKFLGVSQYGIILVKHALNILPDFLLSHAHTHTHGKSWMNAIVCAFMCARVLWIYLFVKHKFPSKAKVRPKSNRFEPDLCSVYYSALILFRLFAHVSDKLVVRKWHFDTFEPSIIQVQSMPFLFIIFSLPLHGSSDL